jgi:HSP20 family protein
MWLRSVSGIDPVIEERRHTMATNGKNQAIARRPRLWHDFDDMLALDAWLPFMHRFHQLGEPVDLLERGAMAPIDMFERGGNIVIKAEMPGIEPDKVEVNVDAGELRITGEREREQEVKEEHYYRSERAYGRVYRAVVLPEGCDTDRIAATTKDGVVEIVIPKKHATSRKIEVKKA